MKTPTYKYLVTRTLFFLQIVLPFIANTQVKNIESLVNQESDFEKKINILLSECEKNNSPSNSLNYSNQAYAYALKIKNNDLIAKSAHQVSIEYYKTDVFDSILKYQDISINFYKKTNNKNGLYDVLLKKFRLYKEHLNTEIAFEIYKELIDLAEKINDPNKIAEVYYNMGSLFSEIDDNEKSINYFNKSLKIYTNNNNEKGITSCYLRLGDINMIKNQNDLAIEYYERGLKLSKQNNNYKMVELLTGIGSVYYSLDNYEKALYYYQEALLNDKDLSNEITLKNNIGVTLMELKRYKEAKPYLIEVYFSKSSVQDKVTYANNLSAIYQNLGEYEKAMDYMEIYVRMNDSLNDALYSKNLSETEAKYQNEKQEEQNILLAERLKNKSLQMYFALAGALLLAGLAFFIFRGLRQKNKANLALAEKNKIIEEKNIIVEEQHKDITDSIKYAQRIQQAILPPDKLWKSILPQSFVFYQPKDILSGDFYWIEETESHIFVAAADCTGHGVPGALMSIVNYNLLNKAVLEQGLSNAGEILSSVNKSLTYSLHQTFQESAMRDGMDVSLCVINKKTKELNFAGAFNSIYIVNHHNISEILPDKQPVGAFIEDNIKDFTNKYYQLTEHDYIYMFTDGYVDQFGGPKGKKYKYKKLQETILASHQKAFNEQKEIFKQEINNWKADLEQVDDMLLIGFKL